MFKESSGKVSLVRVMCFSCLVVGLALPIATFFTDRSMMDVQGTIFALLGCAFTGKVGQKAVEQVKGSK